MGAIVSVTDTLFDFRRLRPIIDVDISYDINFVLRRAQGGLYRAARPRRPGMASRSRWPSMGLTFAALTLSSAGRATMRHDLRSRMTANAQHSHGLPWNLPHPARRNGDLRLSSVAA
jgi:hypothetical protein